MRTITLFENKLSTPLDKMTAKELTSLRDQLEISARILDIHLQDDSALFRKYMEINHLIKIRSVEELIQGKK